MPKKRKEIDWIKVQELCAFGCTAKEVAHFLRLDHKTLERACKREFKQSWTELYEQWYYSKFRVSLRRKMHEKAMKGDTIMLIFMAKNHLEMSDTPVVQRIDATEVQYSFMQNFFPQQQAPAQIEAPQQVLVLPESKEEYRNVAAIPDNQPQRYDETSPDSIFAQQ